MKTIITLDALFSGIPEDGFGIDECGYLFVAICIGGFCLGKKSIIFTFKNNEIIITTGHVNVKVTYQLNNFAYLTMLNLDTYDYKIFEKIFDMHVSIKGEDDKQYRMTDERHVNSILGNVLGRIYKSLGPYFSCNRVNLKRKRYKELFVILQKHDLVLS